MSRSCSIARRNFIGIGVAGGLSLLNNSDTLVALEDQYRDRPGRAKNVLVILEQGGMSHTDTWDPKPNTLVQQLSPERVSVYCKHGYYWWRTVFLQRSDRGCQE